MFQTTLYNGNKSTGKFDSENQIFSTFEEAKQVGLQQVENQIKYAMAKVDYLRNRKEKLAKKTKFSYDETEFWIVSEDAEMFPYIDSIKLVEGKWLTVASQEKSSNTKEELLVFHRNNEKQFYKKTISDDNLFHTFEEAKAHALKLINERKKVMDKKIADKEAELAGFKKLRDNCINESSKYVNTFHLGGPYHIGGMKPNES